MKHSFKINTMAFAVAGVLAGMIGFNGDAFARKTCPDGSFPPCDTTETATNSVSLPLYVISDGSNTGGFTGVSCATAAVFGAIVPPTGTPLSGYSVDPLAYYFVQGINKWQAPCATWDASSGGVKVPVSAAWGDNLTGDAKLKAGSPIRVELVLTYAAPEGTSLTVDGYEVVKLEPSALDRESPYGTLATADGLGGWYAIPELFVPLVFDHKATLTITGTDFSVTEDPASAEINATGKVVYGYNLRVPAAGQYQITYTLPNVDIQSADAGYCVDQTCTLTIQVGGGGGSGGKGGRP